MKLDTMAIQDLAYAIHVTNCQRACGIRNRDLRVLLDSVWNFSQLFDRTANQLAEMLEQYLSVAEIDLVPCQTKSNSRKNHRPINLPPVGEFIRSLLDRSGLEKALITARSSEPLQIYPLASGDPRYPDRLKSVDSSPAVLYVRGTALETALDRPLWATVIGTRTPTIYGQRVTQVITRDLAARGTVIVSGLARGIDTLAHETAIEQNGLTVAVTGCGLDRVYPPENGRLMEKIAECGVLISEHPPGIEPRRQHFPARNRILSGLSDVVAVMEAAQKSGTLITAGFAGDQGRDVFAVPGNILDQASSGCHQLIRDGAKLLEQASDIFREHPVRFVQELLVPLYCQPRIADNPAGQLSGRPVHATSTEPGNSQAAMSKELEQNGLLANSILQILRGQNLTLDQLAELSGQPVRYVITAISFLELGGQIVCQRGRYALTASGQCSI